ncbi:MAG: hypothetical protein PGN27_05465 [Mycolicibacterium neoaurum]|uniref:hypothetical protein n=1 Tax=Mycolicibacterium neoaurum TaxID=1795 RepID=UPI002FF48B7B
MAGRRFLHRLDAYGTDDPDFNEGHPEDRCPKCEDAVIDHPTWRHRLYALWPVLRHALHR